jgi:hypothetical protein
MMIKLAKGSKVIERSQEDWEKNQKMWEYRGFKLYSEEKKSTPKKKKRGKDV